MRIPIKPAASEHTAPIKNPIAVGQPLNTAVRMKMTTAITPMLSTWRFRYAFAPSSMAAATCFIRPSPAGAARMSLMR